MKNDRINSWSHDGDFHLNNIFYVWTIYWMDYKRNMYLY